jgi:UDP-N-acetylglucosamine 2-epimerase
VRLGALDLPEEAHRVVLDHLADLALCPTERAAASLRAERPRGAVVAAGDPLLDALPAGPPAAPATPPRFLATLHRAGNADDPARLRAILRALDGLPHPVDLPLHPRTRRAVDALGPLPRGGALRPGPPIPHGALVDLLRGATAVLTDSGGVQREAYWLGVPCVVLREACEWKETVEEGWAVLAGADPARIAAAAAAPPRGGRAPDRSAFGGGAAAGRWVGAMAERYA